MRWDSGLYDDRHSFVSQLGRGVLDLLSPQAGEHILDVGCGTGHLTHEIAQRGANVLGLDSSPEMIAKARAAYPNIEFRVGDIAEFTSAQKFDAIFSNAALHWVHRAEVAVGKMAEALRVGGRFVVEFGGKGNVQQIVHSLDESIFELSGVRLDACNYFPSISQYTLLLEKHGIEVRSAELFDRPTPLEGGEAGLENWLRMFRGHVLNTLLPEVQMQVIEYTKGKLRATLWRDDTWIADYRRLRIVGIRGKSN